MLRCPPSEEEISDAITQKNRHADKRIVRHKRQHQQITEKHLDYMEYGLYQVNDKSLLKAISKHTM